MPRSVYVASFVAVWLSSFVGAQAPLVATVQLSGRVLDARGQPVGGAAVAFVPRDATTTAQLLAAPPTTTDAEGRFALAVPSEAAPDDLSPPQLQVAAKGMAAVAPYVSWKLQPQKPGATTRARLDTDVGDVLLPEGTRLFGRVRDLDGKPVADAAVTLRDLLDNHRSLSGTQTYVHCRATTNASGIFELPCALANGVAVEIVAKGYLRQNLHAVGVGTPLEVALAPGGRIAGRVVDAKGTPVAGAFVSASYERSGPVTRVRAGADGSFEVPQDYAGRFRVAASRPRPPVPTGARTPSERAESALFAEPVATIELVLAPPPEVAEGTLRVQAVDADGKPVVGIRAVGVWQQYALQNEAYLDYFSNQGQQGVQPAEGNEAKVAGPTEHEQRTGAIRVFAAGYAPATERDVEWPDAEKLADAKPIVVKLVREATVAGKVVDERTGAPIAGARVWVLRQRDPSMGSFGGPDIPTDAVTTGDDGAFRIGQLGEGAWAVRFRHKERPAPTPVDIELKAGEGRDGLELKLAGGATVSGKVTGLPIPPGSKVSLHPVAMPRLSNYVFYSSSSGNQTDLRVPLAIDGSFTFTGIALNNFYLVAELASPPRRGGALFVPIEPFRVRAEGIQRNFDAGQDAPGRLRGTLTFPKAVPTQANLVVVAEQVSDNPDEQSYRSMQQFAGPRAFVLGDGTFDLRVARGTHLLRVVDVATGLLLATSKRITVAAEGAVQHDLAVPLTELAVTLEVPADAGPCTWVDRLEVRLQPPKPEQGGMVVFGGNDEYDAGLGLPVPPGATSVRLCVPEGKVTLLARGNGGSLKAGKERGRMGPVAREELDIAADEKAVRELVLKLGAKPEIEAKEKAEAKPAGTDDTVVPAGR
ncbi:MAG: carboxypeptidase regulatory-like domain-containing protein [Planctomycetes bacterium]|nr:carboxypeptidase regulatory-like domain-containing protein [Planctomycetota bacterium]